MTSLHHHIAKETFCYEGIDNLIDMLKEPKLIILASRPSIGKTNLALNLAYHSSNFDTPVAIFSLELSKKQVQERLLKLSSADTDTPEIFIDDTPQISIEQLHAEIHRLYERERIGLIIIDYIQLMRAAQQTNRANEISQILHELKAIVTDLKIPIIVLSQLSRNLEERPNKRPQLTDLSRDRRAQAIAETADIVMLLYRDAYYNNSSTDNANEPVELLIAKNNGGETGQFILSYDGKSLRFS